MRNRLIVLLATVALLLVGAVPVSAAPGGVPGPPPGHGPPADDVAPDDVEGSADGGKQNGPPEWAQAYGKRIKDAFDIPFGHLQQCARVVNGDEATDIEEASTDDASVEDAEGAKKALEACPDPGEYEFPEGQPGAAAFWVYYEVWVISEEGLPILGF